MPPDRKKEKLSEFLDAAQRLFDDPGLEVQLPRLVRDLPAPTCGQLDCLAREAEKAATRQPRRSWAIAAIADAAVSCSDDDFLKAKAAWYLAKASNEWLRPRRVEEAIRRSQEGFTALGETGWAAACEWQRYANPWTRNDFRLAAEKLSDALHQLESEGMRDELIGCRGSLAYALILRSDFDRALNLIQINERETLERGNRLDYARCLLHRSSTYRRRGELHAAREILQHAQEIFESLDARIEQAKAIYQQGIVQYEVNTDAQAAIDLFDEAREIFLVADLPLWVALCENQTSSVHRFVGEIETARRLLESAQEIYSRYEVFGSLADNYFDSAQLEISRGNYPAGLESFRQAGEYYAKVEAPLPEAHALMLQGYVCVQMGAYQKGLALLERARGQLLVLKNSSWLAGCEIDLAETWIHLHRSDRAMKYLDLAVQDLEQAGGGNLLHVHQYKFRARALMQENKPDEAVESLRLAIELAENNQLQLQGARARLFLGEVFCKLERSDEALKVLGPAESTFASLENPLGQIAAWLFIGEAYLQKGEIARAREFWERACSDDLGLLPDIAWQVHAGLARLALLEGDDPGALHYFHLVFENLIQLRSGFWQPALAGTFLQRSASALDRAVAFAAHLPAPVDTLQFIEESKAQTIAQNLVLYPGSEGGLDSPDLRNLRADIRWLHRELQMNGTVAGFVYRTRQSRFIKQLRNKNLEYEALASQLEREHLERATSVRPEGTRRKFELDSFRQLASENLGERWIAVDYHLGGSELTGVILTPASLSVWQEEVSTAAQLALDICARTRDHRTTPSPIDLARLGELLVPQDLISRLESDTMLLIAPHRRLHKIPWAILPAGEGGKPLVSLSTPCILPSLQYLSALWSRTKTAPVDPGSGFLLAISDFQDRHDPLPLVADEVSRLKDLSKIRFTVLDDGKSTRAGLKGFICDHPLDRFAFLHLATHAFSDPLSGYMSGFALLDEDLYITEMQELAPLPALVTLSACSGAQSLVYEGDELVGIPIACLAAGAQTVIGSLWPVFDRVSPDLMVSFYHDLLSGLSPAQALAMTQRKMRRNGIVQEFWGSFICFGAP